jgi:hypothetical protein
VAPFEYSVIGNSGFMACEVWDRTRSRVLELCRTEQARSVTRSRTTFAELAVHYAILVQLESPIRIT